jgi:hypothetical protein
VLEQNWTALGPKLQGKIHIWVGDADDFLNNAVHQLDEFLSRAQPAYEGSTPTATVMAIAGWVSPSGR